MKVAKFLLLHYAEVRESQFLSVATSMAKIAKELAADLSLECNALSSMAALVEAFLSTQEWDSDKVSPDKSTLQTLDAMGKPFTLLASRLEVCLDQKEKTTFFEGGLAKTLNTIKAKKDELARLAGSIAPKVLQSHQKALKDIGLGAADGTSWKSGLGKTSTFKDVVNASQHLISEAFGKTLFATHSKAHKDSAWGRTQMHVCWLSFPSRIS